MIRKNSYTDSEKFQIMKYQYPILDIDYMVGEPIIINDNKGNKVLVGYVAEVIHKPSGEDAYILTDKCLPEDPTPEQRASVEEVHILFQGSTFHGIDGTYNDWIDTDVHMGITILKKAGKISTTVDPKTTEGYDRLPSSKVSSKLGSNSEYSNNKIGLDKISNSKPAAKLLSHPGYGRHILTSKNIPVTPVESTVSLKQFSDCLDTLNQSMDNYPNAKFRITGHSMTSTISQILPYLCNYPERIIEVICYNGPNGYFLLTDAALKKKSILFDKIFIYADTKDFISMKYKNMPSLGHVFLVDNKDIDSIGQHLGYAYVFNNSGQLINEMGQLVRPFGVVSEIDINNDGVTDLTIKQGNLLKDITITTASGEIKKITDFNLSPTFFSPIMNFNSFGIDILLNTNTLSTLVTDILNDVSLNLSVMSAICSVCITTNDDVKINFETRKKEVYESIRSLFCQSSVPLILDSLYESIGKIMDNIHIFDELSVSASLDMSPFDATHVPEVDGYKFFYENYDTFLTFLKDAAEQMSKHCRSERTSDVSNTFNGKPTIVNSWAIIEENSKKLLERSEKIFEGDGLRTGKEDGIQQALTNVLAVEQNNIKELQNLILNCSSIINYVALSFSEKDTSLGNTIADGNDFVVSALTPNIPQNYEAYLSRSEILDDVKDVLQAFDIQVEKRSSEYAKDVISTYENCLGTFEEDINKWLKLAYDFSKEVNATNKYFEKSVIVERFYKEKRESVNGNTYYVTRSERYIWGRLKKLYPDNITTGIEEALQNILPAIPFIDNCINNSARVKENLRHIEPELKKIIESGVYKAFDLNGIVDSHKIILQLAVKSQIEIMSIKNIMIQAGMKGQAIDTLLIKLTQVNNLFNYFSTFVSDCFGDNYSEAAPASASQVSAVNFSLNSLS